ncbi:ANTAR domain-containing protein [Streptomyces californicus]|uniref:ANTAR domain-containing protein n=1 Tax=Streptomyces californicus TaxID=67351 RepID=UPI003F560326
MGILMARHNIPENQAFNTLRRYSQDHNVKLRDVALLLCEQGALPKTCPRAAGPGLQQGGGTLGAAVPHRGPGPGPPPWGRRSPDLHSGASQRSPVIGLTRIAVSG